MRDYHVGIRIALVCALLVWAGGAAIGAEPQKSKRLLHAMDLIGDEQWARAVDELKATVADPKEGNKDEAMFWLAHSQNQARDSGAAIETIARLEREYPSSPYVRPARSLRVEIAQRLQRRDVLWWTAVPPPPPTPPPTPVASTPPVGPAPPAAAPPIPPPAPPTPHPAAMVRTPAPAPAPPVALPAKPPRTAPPMPPMPPPAFWVGTPFQPDSDLRIQALGILLMTDEALKVIPILRDIALTGDEPAVARRALLVLAQSDRPEARSCVIEVAKTGPEPVKIEAVRQLGRFKGPAVANDLLQVYFTGNAAVKYQVVTSLGQFSKATTFNLRQRDGTTALMQIAQSETEPRLRETAIVTLGEAGGVDQLRVLYSKGPVAIKRPIINGLVNAKAEDLLISIAEKDRDPAIREYALARLHLLGTPRANAYLASLKQK
jgi:hypothetical protein